MKVEVFGDLIGAPPYWEATMSSLNSATADWEDSLNHSGF